MLPLEAGLVLADSQGVRTFRRADVERDAIRMAGALGGQGVRRGDSVLVILDNSADYVSVLFALMHLDVSIVLVDPGQEVEQIRRVALSAKAGWVVVGSGGVEPAEMGDVGTVLSVADLRVTAGAQPAPLGRLSVDAWRQRRNALISYSSGSTGAPKAIAKSGTALWENAERTRIHLGYLDSDVLLPLLPFSHQYGFSVVLVWWLAGCSLVIAPYTRVDRALELAVRTGVTVVDATPPTYHGVLGLLERREALRDQLSTVRMWCAGGAPLGRPLAERFLEQVGAPLLDGYGSTEAGNIALATLRDPGGCGRPLAGVELQILDDEGRPVSPGRTGEICVRTDGLFEGYLAEDGTLQRRAGDWYRTHDLGYQDGDGNLHVLGRKHAVNRLGYTMYPEELERKAEACGRPVTVIPLDDERRGCQLVFVVADPDLHGEQHWRRLMSGHLAYYEQPNQVVVVESFPVNVNGKPNRTRLEQIVIDRSAAPASRRVGPVRAESAVAMLPERVASLTALHAAIKADPSPVMEILTEISNYAAARAEIEVALDTLQGAVKEIETYRPGPVSRMAVFMSSNVIFYSYVMQLLVPSLFVNELGFRPSSQVADSTRRLHELLSGSYKQPITLYPLSQRLFVEGPVADADLVTFTGTYKNAEEVRLGLRPEQLFLYFGQGVNPFIVGPDADLDLAVTDAIRIRLLNSGQDCFGPDAFFVHDSCFDQFIDGLTKRVGELRVGEYVDPDADYGPMYYDTALEDATEYLRMHSEYIVSGGRVDFRTRHVEPTILARRFNAKPAVEELFSPIFNVMRYDSAKQLQDRLSCGFFNERAMGAMVYGVDRDTVNLLAKRHTVCENSTLLDIDNGNKPFGGYGIIANYIAHRGKRIAEPLLISKAVADHLTSANQQRAVPA